eukprot:UC1_evm3s2008
MNSSTMTLVLSALLFLGAACAVNSVKLETFSALDTNCSNKQAEIELVNDTCTSSEALSPGTAYYFRYRTAEQVGENATNAIVNFLDSQDTCTTLFNICPVPEGLSSCFLCRYATPQGVSESRYVKIVPDAASSSAAVTMASAVVLALGLLATLV